MSRLTAEEARKLAGDISSKELEATYNAIKQAASKGEHQIVIKNHFWAEGIQQQLTSYHRVKAELVEAGFNIRTLEGPYRVIISWH